MAPKATSRDIFVGQAGNIIKGEGSSSSGYRASGVPGTLAGFEMAFKKYGSGKEMWRDLVEPSRLLAQNGYVLSYRLAEQFKNYRKNLSQYDESTRVFLRGGNDHMEDEVFKQPV